MLCIDFYRLQFDTRSLFSLASIPEPTLVARRGGFLFCPKYTQGGFLWAKKDTNVYFVMFGFRHGSCRA